MCLFIRYIPLIIIIIKIISFDKTYPTKTRNKSVIIYNNYENEGIVIKHNLHNLFLTYTMLPKASIFP